MAALLLSARFVFATSEITCEEGGVLLARGRVARVLAGRRAVLRCARQESVRPLDLGDRVLAPGFVDAHAHLELTGLEGRLSPGGSFASWIRALVRARSELSAGELRRAAIGGAQRLLAGGTTCVGDVDSSGASEAALPESPVRATIYREILDAGDAGRARSALRRARRSFPRSGLIRPGLSPHAPYTAGGDLLRGACELAARRRWPVAIHWAETEEEVEWLARARGPFSRILPAPREPRGERLDGLSRIERAGLLTPRLALVHGNHPGPGDVERVARSGATLVHCPGTHAFFGRDPFDLEGWLEAGVIVALGTDGLSSNRDLDMRAEMALLRRSQPWLPPRRVFDMATRAGACALGLQGLVGTIERRAFGDLCAHGFPGMTAREARDPEALMETLTSGRSTVDAAWIAGRPVLPGAEFPRRISESPRRIAE